MPALLVSGGSDADEEAAETMALWRRARARGAPWALVHRNDAPHPLAMADFELLNALFVPWIAGVVEARGPQPNGGPAEGTSWLPNEASPAAWQTLSTRVRRP